MHASGRLWVLRLAAAAMLLLVVARAALFTTYRVAGASMREALQDGDRIVVASHPWLVQPVLAGDTVILRVEDEVLVKRVMACPAESR